jgi:hypothetical protein
MTHDRGGTALIGSGALALLTADLVYVGVRWRGLHDRFDRGFLLSFVVVVAVGLLGRTLGLGKPIGPDRKKARLRARFTNLVALVVILLLVSAAEGSGGHAATGVLFGEVAAASGFFAVFTGWWIARHQRPSQSA